MDAITSNATTLGMIGSTFLLWTSLSLFSVLESAFNIVYPRPNRPFLHGKFLATLFMAGSVIFLLELRSSPAVRLRPAQALLAGLRRLTFYVAYGALDRDLDRRRVRLPRRRVRTADEHRAVAAEVWSGRALASVMLQATFQVLPLFVRFSNEVVAVQALGARRSSSSGST